MGTWTCIVIKAIIGVGTVVCLALSVIAQSSDPLIFRSDSRLIEVSIRATKDGFGPVLDLTKDDFRVRDNKQDEAISLFIPPDASSRSFSVLAEPQPQVQVASQIQPSSTAIVLDWLNTGFAEQVYARQMVVKMLRTIRLTDRVAVFANFRTLRVLHDFTDDNTSLLESLLALSTNLDYPLRGSLFGNGDDIAAFASLDNAIRIDATKRNIQPVIDMLRRQPGTKSLIWISNSFNLPTSDLIRADITVYTVDARGLQTKPLPSINPGEQAKESFEARLDEGMRYAMRSAAESTGGVYFGNRNDLDGAMREALADTHTSYTLGYYLSENTPVGRHKIQINVNRRGVNLRFRENYTIDP